MTSRQDNYLQRRDLTEYSASVFGKSITRDIKRQGSKKCKLALSIQNCPEDCYFNLTDYLFLVLYWDEVYEIDHKVHLKTTKGVETFSMKGSPNIH